MTDAAPASALAARAAKALKDGHFLTVKDLSRDDCEALIELGAHYAAFNREQVKKTDVLRGRTLINLFFEPSTRTQASFELAGKRLGADVLNLPVATSSTAKGETLIDTAKTLDAMQPDFLVVRHAARHAPHEVAANVDCAVLNAGDGANEHPTQALLDALAIRQAFGRVDGLRVAICGDVKHSRVAGSSAVMLQTLGAEVRFAGPTSFLPDAAPNGVQMATNLKDALDGCDIVMMLRVQMERLSDSLGLDRAAFYEDWGLTSEKLKWAKPGAKVMHPGPMNRGVEIEGRLADDAEWSLILSQVEMGVAARMAVLHALAVRD